MSINARLYCCRERDYHVSPVYRDHNSFFHQRSRMKSDLPHKGLGQIYIVLDCQLRSYSFKKILIHKRFSFHKFVMSYSNVKIKTNDLFIKPLFAVRIWNDTEISIINCFWLMHVLHIFLVCLYVFILQNVIAPPPLS